MSVFAMSEDEWGINSMIFLIKTRKVQRFFFEGKYQSKFQNTIFLLVTIQMWIDLFARRHLICKKSLEKWFKKSSSGQLFSN